MYACVHNLQLTGFNHMHSGSNCHAAATAGTRTIYADTAAVPFYSACRVGASFPLILCRRTYRTRDRKILIPARRRTLSSGLAYLTERGPLVAKYAVRSASTMRTRELVGVRPDANGAAGR